MPLSSQEGHHWVLVYPVPRWDTTLLRQRLRSLPCHPAALDALRATRANRRERHVLS